jgi:hypothetical protein
MHFDGKGLRSDWHGMLDPLARDLFLATGIGVGDLSSAPFRNLEDIPQFADRSNGGLALSASNRAAQAHDFRINCGLFDRRAGPPHTLLQGFTRQGFSRMLHENLKKTKLLHGQLKWLAAPPNPDRFPIKQELADDYQVVQGSFCRAAHFIHGESCYWSTLANLSSRA